MRAPVAGYHPSHRLLTFLLAGLLAVVGVTWPVAAVPAPLEVEVTGVEDALLDNVEAYLGEPPDVANEAAARGYARNAREQADQALQALGYFGAKIETTVEPQDEGWLVGVAIEPGKPVILRDVQLKIQGDAADDDAFQQLKRDMPLREGEPLNQGAYESVKSSLGSLALSRGYFDFSLPVHRIEVNRDERRATVRLVFDSGRRYRLGEVRFNEPYFGDDLLGRLVPFEPDTPYLASRVAQLNRNLLDSGYFQDVRVRPQREQAVERVMPVDVGLTLREPNSIGTGVGFSTDEGPRVRFNWDVHYVNDSGHQLLNELYLSGVRQNVTSRYVIPLRDPLTDTLEFSAGFQAEDFEDTQTKRVELGVRRQQRFNSGWKRTQSLRWLREDFEVGDQEGTTALLLPGIAFSRTRSRGGIDPYWGDSQNYAIEAGEERLLSDISIVRSVIGGKLLRSLGAANQHRFLFRVDVGAIATSDFEDVPPSLRFYAGGDQSVRGYAYQSLSPEDDDGDEIGGRYLLTGSAEYQYEVIENWRAAVFTDAGNAYDDFGDPVKVGAGVGVRWSSPVGPVRLDFAFGVSEDNPPFRIHFSLGPPL